LSCHNITKTGKTTDILISQYPNAVISIRGGGILRALEIVKIEERESSLSQFGFFLEKNYL